MGRMVICMRCGGEVIAEVFFGGEKRGEGFICVDFGD